MVAGGTVGKRHASHTKKARTIAGDTVAKGAKRLVTRTAPGVRTVSIKSGGAAYTRTITKTAGHKATRSAFTKSGGTPPPATSSSTAGNGQAGFQPGEFSNLKSRKKRRTARKAAKKQNSTPPSQTPPPSGNNSGD